MLAGHCCIRLSMSGMGLFKCTVPLGLDCNHTNLEAVLKELEH